MGRFQTGYIYEAFNAFHVRFYVTEIVDAKPTRVQRSKRLCSKDEKHHSRTCKPVKKLCADFMAEINKQVPGNANKPDITIGEFWTATYFPFVKENRRASTVHGYEQIWNQHLQVHFGNMTLKEYRTHMGSAFLTGLARTLGRHTLQHIRALVSGLFSHAVNLGLVESNPCRDMKILGKTKEPGDTPHYSLGEAESISNALHETGHPREQLIFCLACFCGLRPGEIAGLKWEDVGEDEELLIGDEEWQGWIHIRRSVVRREVGETKTPESVASVPLIPSVRLMFSAWRAQSGNPTTGWVFQTKAGDPVNLEAVARHILIPTLKAKKLPWKALYAGRRASGTLLTQLTGNALAAQLVLRHKNLATTTAYYVKPSREAAVTGMRLLAGKLEERKSKALAAASDGAK